ncbi:MFS transporter [Acinetobacter puyangensis]|uniref:MFS transporter n=1 Tax=Acinetobacter puyangensis TaxID=1096779 RepID=UPI003A4D5FF3
MQTNFTQQSGVKRINSYHLLLTILGIYITQTFIHVLVTQSVPVLMRQAGASLQMVGLSTLLMLPWAIKFIWAPWVERWRLPLNSHKRNSRRILLAGQYGMVAIFLLIFVLGQFDILSFNKHHEWLFAALFVNVLFAASIDVAADGFAIDQFKVENRSWINVAQVGGGYLGMLLGSSGFLLVTSYFGWQYAVLLAGIIILLLTIPTQCIQEPDREAYLITKHYPSLSNAFKRSEIWLGLGLTFLLGIGIRMSLVIMGPVLIDKSADLNTIGWLYGTFSVLCGLVGTFIGWMIVRYISGWKAVIVAVLLQGCSLMIFGLLAESLSIYMTIIFCGLIFGVMACGFVTIYTALMNLTSPYQAGVDFTLFQCADASVAIFGGIMGGLIAQHWGYRVSFLIAAVCAFVAVVILIINLKRITAISLVNQEKSIC